MASLRQQCCADGLNKKIASEIWRGPQGKSKRSRLGDHTPGFELKFKDLEEYLHNYMLELNRLGVAVNRKILYIEAAAM